MWWVCITTNGNSSKRTPKHWGLELEVPIVFSGNEVWLVDLGVTSDTQ